MDENTHDVVVMRIKALDEDLEHTDNWLTIFTIVKGNEENLFSIETDNETNEGILKLIKVHFLIVFISITPLTAVSYLLLSSLSTLSYFHPNSLWILKKSRTFSSP